MNFNNLNKFGFRILVSLFLVLLCSPSKAQVAGDDVVVHNDIHVEFIGTIDLSNSIAKDWYAQLNNTWIAPSPLVEDKSQFKVAKDAANLDCEMNARNAVSHKSGQSQSAIPVLGANFNGNSISGTPNDNGIAVDNAGKVVSVVNTSVSTYRASSSSAVLNNRSLAVFVGLPGNAFVFDPRVSYDPEQNRFILIFLKDAAVGSSTIYVAFSATDDPFGTWNSYAISGTVGNRWTDYPQLAIGKEEFFMTGNMADDGAGGVVSGSIWQVNKFDGYNASPTLGARVFSVGEVGWHPVQGGSSLYGPNQYFIRTSNSPSGTTRAVWLRTISNTIANNGVLSSAILFNSDITYTMPADASQKGSSVKLMTNSSSVSSSYLQNGKIQFAISTQFNSKPAVYYGTFTISPIDISFSSVTGINIGIDSFHLGYPSIAYAGTDGNENRSVVGFNFASVDHFPSNGCVFVDETGSVSPPLVCKKGFTFMDANMGASTRWGDYGGAAERCNNVGEVWLGLSIGMGSGARNGCWISQIYAAGASPIAREENFETVNPEMIVYPNPAPEMAEVTFEIQTPGLYSVHVFDGQGKKVEEFGHRRLKAGGAKFSFNVQTLANGTYFLSLRNENLEVAQSKLIVQHP